MEHLKDNRVYEQVKSLGGRILEGYRTGGMSLMTRPAVLDEEKKKAIESRGYNQETVQDFIDNLQSLGVRGQEKAAMLRGAFNELIDRLTQSEEGGK